MIEKLISTARQVKKLMLDEKVHTIKVYPDGSSVPKVFHVEKRGRWIKYIPPIPEKDDGVEAWDCSECSAMVSYPTNYCPNCGAKMEK